MTADKYSPQAVLMWLETDHSQLLARRSVQLWAAIADELMPIVGDRGLIALFNRCIDICGTTFPWLLKAPARSSPTRCFDALGAQLSEREPRDGLAASRALFGTFHDLLLMLIGEPLAGGVLDAAWRDLLRHPDGKPASFPAQSVPEEQDEHKHR
ncbi:MAG: hypothetical protein V4641_29900 [Pseudomonadota bacterium]